MAITQIKRIMFEREISLKELSLETGISYNNLSRIVNGKQTPHLDTAHLIAETLNLHINKVFPNLYSYEQIKKKRTKR